MTRRREIVAIARLDFSEVVRSRWLGVCVGIYGLLAAVFVLVGLRESSVMGFTGMGRVLFSFSHALVLLLPLVSLVLTGQVINRARDDGALELFLSHPVRRSSYFGAVTLVRTLALVVPLAVMLLGLAAVGRLAYGEAIPWAFAARCTAVSVALVWAFVGLGLAISVRVRSAPRALTYLILAWAAGVALLDFALIGVMLSRNIPPQFVFALAGANPVEMARLALLSTADPELATFGPVGFYLAHRLGASALFALGVGWPAAFGTALWAIALRWFRRSDAV